MPPSEGDARSASAIPVRQGRADRGCAPARQPVTRLASRDDFRELMARYSVISREIRVVIVIQGSIGRSGVGEYVRRPAGGCAASIAGSSSECDGGCFEARACCNAVAKFLAA
jgi:hypothetical protein